MIEVNTLLLLGTQHFGGVVKSLQLHQKNEFQRLTDHVKHTFRHKHSDTFSVKIQH